MDAGAAGGMMPASVLLTRRNLRHEDGQEEEGGGEMRMRLARTVRLVGRGWLSVSVLACVRALRMNFRSRGWCVRFRMGALSLASCLVPLTSNHHALSTNRQGHPPHLRCLTSLST
ncbi:hypothetical protein FIBSPDRAFT_859492 [Athelia psychrophila]|uniref:Uncharacterized protein n=1 Tax=Athelia psychrophila TaxID=1759441 RepID=A0A166L038_9AGAM|nr:hypothetical protein FIBSPDRAFT_859492 [Fibularhizoctonia sp. CBS 109695]